MKHHSLITINKTITMKHIIYYATTQNHQILTFSNKKILKFYHLVYLC